MSYKGLTLIEKLRLAVDLNSEKRFLKEFRKLDDNLDEIVNEKYTNVHGEVLTLLHGATQHGNFTIIKNLFEKCNVNVNVTGNVFHSDNIFVEGATALWLAAASGHLEIVKFLIDHGATLDCFTKENSDPLNAACYFDQKIEIVKYLIDHGANVNTVNIMNRTCLMSAAIGGDEEIVRYLLNAGAEINSQCIKGNTALHFAANYNNLEIIKILLEFNALHLKNNQSLTPIMCAAAKVFHEIVSYLQGKLNLTREELIDLNDLLGASFIKKGSPTFKEKGFSLLLYSMEMRYNNPVILKKNCKLIEDYDNRMECQTIEELLNIKNNLEALYYESLMIRERIMGENNEELFQSLIFCDSKYLDAQHSAMRLKIVNHGLKIALKYKFNDLEFNMYLMYLTQFFTEMIEDNNMNIELSYFKNLLQLLCQNLKMNSEKILAVGNSKTKITRLQIGYINSIYLALDLVKIATKLLPTNYENGYPGSGLVKEINTIISELIIFDPKVKGQTLLHLSLKKSSNKRSVTSTIGSFPDFHTMKLLINYGANVNAVDDNQNTPLHVMGEYIKCKSFPLINHGSDGSPTKCMVMELINAGAHVDYVNKKGECPYTGYLKTVFHYSEKLSLKCLSARTLRNQWPEEAYQDKLPSSLKEFIKLHGC